MEMDLVAEGVVIGLGLGVWQKYIQGTLCSLIRIARTLLIPHIWYDLNFLALHILICNLHYVYIQKTPEV